MTEIKSFLIGPAGLTIAVLTVLAFVVSMVLRSLASNVAVPSGGTRTSNARPRAMSALLVLVRLRWPLAILTLLLTAYRIVSLS